MIVWKNGSHENAICRSSAQQSAIKINLFSQRSVKLWEIKLKVCDFIKTFGHFGSIKSECVCAFHIHGNSQLTCLLPEPASWSNLTMFI